MKQLVLMVAACATVCGSHVAIAETSSTIHFVPASPFQTSEDSQIILGDVAADLIVEVLDDSRVLAVMPTLDSARFATVSYSVMDFESGISSEALVLIDLLEGVALINATATIAGAEVQFTGEASTASGAITAASIAFKGNPDDVKKAKERLDELKKNAPEKVLEKLKVIEESEITINVVNDKPKVFIGDFKERELDVADFGIFPKDGGGRTDDSGFLHEIVEQYENQVNNKEFPVAHKLAIEAETQLTGNEYRMQLGPVKQVDNTYMTILIWYDSAGNRIEQVLIYDPKTDRMTVK